MWTSRRRVSFLCDVHVFLLVLRTQLFVHSNARNASQHYETRRANTNATRPFVGKSIAFIDYTDQRDLKHLDKDKSPSDTSKHMRERASPVTVIACLCARSCFGQAPHPEVPSPLRAGRGAVEHLQLQELGDYFGAAGARQGAGWANASRAVRMFLHARAHM